MMETLIVMLIIAAAAVYVGRVFYKGFNKKGGCACGCTCCGISDACRDLTTGGTGESHTTRQDR